MWSRKLKCWRVINVRFNLGALRQTSLSQALDNLLMLLRS